MSAITNSTLRWFIIAALALGGCAAPVGGSGGPGGSGDSGDYVEEDGDAQAYVAGDVDFGKYDDPACVQRLHRFFQGYADVTDDFLRYWKQEHKAFGMADNAITFSWEMEGTNRNILKYYRPSSVDDATWAAKSMAERTRYFQDELGGTWRNFTRMDDAPEYLRESLAAEAGGRVWETTTHAYTRTADDLFDQALFVQRNVDDTGGFHWHVAFKHNTEYADDVTEFLAQGNEYTTLKMFAGSPKNVHHKYLGPYTTENLNKIRQGLRSGNPVGDKFSTLSLRTGLYGEPERIGFEIRAVNYDLDVARSAVGNSIRFLDDPRNAVIGFGKQTRGYTVSQVSGVDRLGPHVLDRFSPQVQQFLDDAARAAEHSGGLGAPIKQRWAVPMVQWESRAHITDDVARGVESSRATFVSKLEDLATEYSSSGREVGPEAQNVIENLVYKWARETRLWEHF